MLSSNLTVLFKRAMFLNPRCFLLCRRSVSTLLQRNELHSLIEELRLEKGSRDSVGKFAHVLKYLETFHAQWGLLSAYLDNLESVYSTMAVIDLLDILERVSNIARIRSKASIMETVRRITAGSTSLGVSSFSLDAILRYAKLCKLLRLYPDKMFTDAACSRVCHVFDSSGDDLDSEMAMYLIDLNSVWSHQVLHDRLSLLSESTLVALPLSYLASLEGLDEPPQGLSSSLAIHSQRPIADLLSELQSTNPASKVFSAIAQICDECPLPNPKLISLYLSVCTKRNDRLPQLIMVYQKALHGASLQLLPDLLASMASIGQDIPVPLKTLIAQKVCQSMQLDLWDSTAVLNVLEALTVLRIHSVEIIGPMFERAEIAQDTTWWKFAVWWRFVENQIGTESILHGVIEKQFPNACSGIASMCQPPMRRNNARLSTHLKKAHAAHTMNPVIRNTPLRAHALITLPDSQICYIFLLRDNGKLLQVCKDSRVSVQLVTEFVHAANAMLCLLPFNVLADENADILDLVHRSIV